eukprot:CAMPEP_0182581306 /NCGR_PEP_ID=MMETSP1324-20130603/49601_1 /TAXON_ID=236786 /ORGANISM="Florenciella sp., Strain RCC1587" /LENGTH=192 /DNA_ID=CAMNT_0024797651 /DNA_START=63 /DNA_END=638 /DNA_ORIENTATION=-
MPVTPLHQGSIASDLKFSAERQKLFSEPVAEAVARWARGWSGDTCVGRARRGQGPQANANVLTPRYGTPLSRTEIGAARLTVDAFRATEDHVVRRVTQPEDLGVIPDGDVHSVGARFEHESVPRVDELTVVDRVIATVGRVDRVDFGLDVGVGILEEQELAGHDGGFDNPSGASLAEPRELFLRGILDAATA